MKKKIMQGYKGFDKAFRCRDFQFRIGETVKHEGELSMCVEGFHFCENPLDVLAYYPFASSRFAAARVSERADSGLS